MPNEHTWKETTPEGEKREVRAVKFGRQWRIQSKLKGEATWTYHDKPSLEDLRELCDLLFRKYQRRRAPYEDWKDIEERVKEMEAEQQE